VTDKRAAEHTRKAFAVMVGAYPFWGKQHTVESARMWCSLLEDLPEQDLLPAVNRLVKASERPPSVAEIRTASTMIRRVGGSCAEVVAKAKAEGP
jgi:hypothetical protein